jgi:hypothetical protein
MLLPAYGATAVLLLEVLHGSVPILFDTNTLKAAHAVACIAYALVFDINS